MDQIQLFDPERGEGCDNLAAGSPCPHCQRDFLQEVVTADADRIVLCLSCGWYRAYRNTERGSRNACAV